MDIEWTTAFQLGSDIARNMAKSLVINPSVAYDGDSSFYIPLEITEYQQTGTAEVSQHPIIVPGTGTKSYYNDNVVPQPWKWTLSGYIPSTNLEITNYITLGMRYRCDKLRQAYYQGLLITFKDKDLRVYDNVAISKLIIYQKSEVANKVPFSMELTKIEEIPGTATSIYSVVQQNATPSNGTEADAGVTPTQSVEATQMKTMANAAGFTVEGDGI